MPMAPVVAPTDTVAAIISAIVRCSIGTVTTSHVMSASWTGTHNHVTTRNQLLNARSGASRPIGAMPDIQSSTGSTPKMTTIGATANQPRLYTDMMMIGGSR